MTTHDTSENQNYQGFQNPSSNYSSSQNPPGAYLNNQNSAAPSKRVAQAKPSAPIVKSSIKKISEKILKELYPGGEMNAVKVLPYSANPNPLVGTGVIGSFGAWTQNKNLIYVQNQFADVSMRHLLQYILKHEAIHILQFQKSATKHFSFIKMLKVELEDYGDTRSWVEGKPTIHQVPKELEARKIIDKTKLKEVKKTASDAVGMVNGIKGLKNTFFIKKDFTALEGSTNKEYNYLRSFINKNSSEDRCALIAFIRHNSLPVIKNKKLYKVTDLYEQWPKGDPRYTKLGY